MKKILFVLIGILAMHASTAHAAVAADITFTSPQDVTAEATSSAGAYVSFSVTAVDASNKPLSVTCAPASGSLFALGSTTVMCSATDTSPATSTTSFTVGVVDTTPPSITPPPTQTFATSTFPATPSLTYATASDLVDPSPKVTASPTTFDAGTTTVTWTATDSSGNSAATTSLVVITDDSASTTSATSSAPVPTPSPIGITLEIDTATTTLFKGPLTVSACSANGATSTVSGYCALQQSGHSVSWQWFSFGAALVRVDGIGDWNNGPWWSTFSNGQPLSDSLDRHLLAPGETLLVTDGPMPLELSVSTTSPSVDGTTTVTVQGFNASNFDFEPVANSTINGAGVTTNASGTVDILATTTDPFTISASANGYLQSNSVTIAPAATSTATSTPPVSSGGGGGGIAHNNLDIQHALQYLVAHQNADGSFDTPMLTDWAALALVAADPGSDALAKLKAYEKTATPTMSSVTDYERHAIALEALGVDPYNGTSVNYIAPIVAAFDGTQIGDPSEDNDDIFAILALSSAGYSPTNDMMQKTATFILSRQKPDGSWDESPDLTAAALQVLPQFFAGTSVSPATLGAALGNGEMYLLNAQHADGGWSNGPTSALSSASSVDSTSWVQTFINAVNLDDPTNARTWTSSAGYLPTDVIASAQQSDGGVQPTNLSADTRVWSTEYALVAAAGKDWDSLQQPFSQPSTAIGGGGGMPTIESATTTGATSTPRVATTTPSIASTTLPFASTTSVEATSTVLAELLRSLQAASTFLAEARSPTRSTHHVVVPSSPAMNPTPTANATVSSTQPQLSQTASAATGDGNALANAWHAIVSFFAKLF